ncbi:hypothetical protein GCM10010199_16500 [Dactylosporangium roseum]
MARLTTATPPHTTQTNHRGSYGTQCPVGTPEAARSERPQPSTLLLFPSTVHRFILRGRRSRADVRRGTVGTPPAPAGRRRAPREEPRDTDNREARQWNDSHTRSS